MGKKYRAWVIYLPLSYNGIKTACVGINWKETQRHKIITALQGIGITGECFRLYFLQSFTV